MKLIIQIPCYNEAETLPVTLPKLPRKVKGFSRVEWLVINDGSKDRTTQTARRLGVDYIVEFTRNKGLAAAFQAGLAASLQNGADVIVNTDADNQYQAKDIEKLVRPILAGQADIVVGSRPIDSIRHFSVAKKALQKFGSWMVRRASQTRVTDAPSGFRAFSREAALKLNIFSKYTYTLESIIQAGQKNLHIESVPIRVNEGKLRPSRLIKNIFSYLSRSFTTILRMFVVYRPFQFFTTLGLTVFALGILVGLRFLYFYFTGAGQGHVQSLILAAVFLGMGFQTMLVAFLADLLAVNRRLLEDVQYYQRKTALPKTAPPRSGRLRKSGQ